MAKVRREDTAHRVSVVLERVRQDLQRQWSVKEMAALLDVTEGQLRRLFAQGVGDSPRTVLANLRLQVAAELLGDPTIRIKDVLRRVGLSDGSHFSRDFRERFGASPTEFRTTTVARLSSANK